MTTTNVPSDKFEDLKRDIEDASRYSNSTSPYTNRAGRQIRPIPLQAQDIAANIAASEQALANSGFIPKGDFSTGGTVENKNEIFSDGTDYWRYDGALPFTVTAGSSPTPTGVGAWINVSDGALRSQLADVDSSALVGGVEAKSIFRSFPTVADMKLVSLPLGVHVSCSRYLSGGELVEGLVYEVVDEALVDNEVDHLLPNGLFAKLVSNGTLRASQAGLVTETLFDSTQDYKGVTYPVKRYTQNKDIQSFMTWFVGQDRFHTFDFEDKKLYMSFVVIGDFSGKHLVGSGGENCGIIKGAINYADGTKSTSVKGVGFFGEIDYLSLPLPVTIDPALENDPNFFWYLDDLDFGFGFGALGALTASSDGNTSDILVEDCYFEMRDAVISGGSAPDDEDRPKVEHVTFRNNRTKGIMFHGFASIHFRYSKVYGNHFYEHYNGYACDFSLGSQESEFFSNTGDRLAAGFKSEPRSFDASFRNRFYNNRLTIRWRWENTGAGFNILFRTKGREIEMYDNALTCFDFSPIDKYALNLEGLSTNIKNNDFYIKGTPDANFLWFAQLKNGINVPTAGQHLLFKDNNIYNETSLELRAMLQITTTGSNSFSLVDVTDNICSGSWDSFVRPEFATAGDVIDKLNIVNNVFPNTALFRPNSAFTLNNVVISENTVVPKDSDSIVNVGFITLNDRLVVKNNNVKSEEGGAGTVSFVIASNSVGDLTNADILITGNTLSPFTGSLAYFFAGGVDLPVTNVVISANDVTWKGASSFTNFVLAKGATTFAMNANTLINQLSNTAGTVARPVDGTNSKFDNNMLIGSITDAPA